MFSSEVLDHFQNPRNVGELPPPAMTVEVSNPACGDILRLSVRVEQGSTPATVPTAPVPPAENKATGEKVGVA